MGSMAFVTKHGELLCMLIGGGGAQTISCNVSILIESILNECSIKRVNISNAPILVYLKDQHARVISKQYLGSMAK